jgi:hypothetical protein
MLAEISRYLDELKATSSQSYYQLDDDNSLEFDADYLSKLVNGGYTQGIANQVANAGTTITYGKEYHLTQDGGYFIYWLMQHFAFLEDKGFKTNYTKISRNLSTGWGRTIISSGTYNDKDKAFLDEVREWMIKTNWVYKKPTLTEHNETLPLIQRLPKKLLYS